MNQPIKNNEKSIALYCHYFAISVIGISYLLVSFSPPEHAIYQASSTKLPTDYANF